jgi:hypothetical protein
LEAIAQSVVGTAEHYAAFVQLCRQRIEQLNITYSTVDEICGFPDRYTAILLSGGKRMSVFSLFALARGLALLPMFGHDPDQLERLRQRSNWVLYSERVRSIDPARPSAAASART